jgi:hypothetical protein
MNMNRDADALRSSSHTQLRPQRRPAKPTVDGEVVVITPRVHRVVVAVTRRLMVMEARKVTSVTGADAS